MYIIYIKIEFMNFSNKYIRKFWYLLPLKYTTFVFTTLWKFYFKLLPLSFIFFVFTTILQFSHFKIEISLSFLNHFKWFKTHSSHLYVRVPYRSYFLTFRKSLNKLNIIFKSLKYLWIIKRIFLKWRFQWNPYRKRKIMNFESL